MWDDFLAAVALVLVLEGILPFVAPNGMRKAWLSMAGMDSRTLRITGLLSMMLGLMVLYLVR